MIFLMFSAMVINLSCLYIIMLIFDKLETEKKKNPNKKNKLYSRLHYNFNITNFMFISRLFIFIICIKTFSIIFLKFKNIIFELIR